MKGVLVSRTHIKPRGVHALNETKFLVTYSSGILGEDIGSAIEKIDDWLDKLVVIIENVGFSFCLLIIMKLNYVQISINRTDFVTKHKLSPVNLTWLFQVYGKMFFFPIG